MTAFEWGLLLLLSFLWGGSFFFVGVAVKELPPLTIVVLRVALAALMLHIVIRMMGIHLPRTREAWFAFFSMGLLNNAIPFGLIVWGQTQIASGVASILNATTPLFTVVVAHYLTADEKMSGGRLFGVMAGFSGVAFMIGGTAMNALGLGVLAQIGILVAALSYAFASVFGRRFHTMGIAPLATATGQVTASSLMLLPLMLIFDRPWTLSWPSANVVAAMIGLALLSTALAYILYFRILATAGATNLALVTFLIPVSAILLGVLMLGEKLESRHVVGMGLIAIGLAAVDGRIWRMLKPKSAPA
ncbi:DMT family transporter [Phyllobacterium salinisoli]|uniref:DMT family transporter n=2 Tax=Phyllobacterium salinisoli TaxID=1899321 RepID=A0A368K9K8_9HYPH|nr:DMT family transporter [Phyllobacterium salinisoli]